MSAHTLLPVAKRLFATTTAVLSLFVAIAVPAYAGGPLDLVNHQPVVYPNGGASITLNLDRGNLGNRTNAQAVSLVQNAIALWNGVSTSTMRLTIGTQLPADYNATNYTAVMDKYSDGVNPVIFDSDGSLTDLLFGAGAKTNILGFAGSAYYTSGASAGKYAEGQAVLNGYLGISDATWTTVLAHEFGHFFGLDHSQLDSAEGLVSGNYVLMYPIAYRTLATLHEDDIAAVSALYPSGGFGSVYGQLSGNLLSASNTPILGVNVWARENTSGKVYSVVSDYLTQGTGYFKLSLPAGTYTLHAESIRSSFTGGSGVGPYSSSSSDLSFRAPNPILPVVLGGVSPMQIGISAGCTASATFRLDGSGVVSGNCGVAAPPAPVLSSAASRKSHGVSGSFDLPLSLVPTNPTVEPRQGPTATVVMTFNKPLLNAFATITEGSASVASIAISGNAVIVGLNNVANAQYVTVSLTNVASTDGGTGGSGSARLGFLFGDVNGSRSVTIADLLAVDAVLAQTISSANFVRDVNLSGTFTIADKLAVNASITQSLPAP